MAHATLEQLIAFLGVTDVDDGDRLLERASEVIDDHVVTAVYAVVDTAGTPADARIVNALTRATCAQVEYWLAGDEEDDILGPLQGLTLAGMQLQYGAGDNRATPMYLAPRAYRILSRAGLVRSVVDS